MGNPIPQRDMIPALNLIAAIIDFKAVIRFPNYILLSTSTRILGIYHSSVCLTKLLTNHRLTYPTIIPLW